MRNVLYVERNQTLKDCVNANGSRINSIQTMKALQLFVAGKYRRLKVMSKILEYVLQLWMKYEFGNEV